MPNDQKIVAMPTGEKIGFPSTMQDSEINNVLTNWIPGSGMAPQGPVAPQPLAGKMQPAMSWSQPSQFETEVGKGMGFDVGKIQGATGKGLPKNQELFRQAISGMTGWGKSTLKDPSHIADPIEGMASSVETAAKERSPGQMLGALSNVAGSMEVTDPKQLSQLGMGPSSAELKTGVADVAYKRGLGVAENLKNASAKIDDAVGQAAQRFISKVDTKFKNGAIDPNPIMDSVNKVKAEIVKTPEKFPPALASMLEPPETMLDQASVFKGAGKTARGAGTLDDLSPAAKERLFKQDPALRREIEGPERAQGGPSGMPGTMENWTADEAKQWRTKIGSAMMKTQGPMKSVLTDAYNNLTQQMRKAADDSGALSDFQDYNNLHKKHMGFLNDPVVSKIMDGTTSKETLGPLADPEKMTHVQNLLDDWDKYGIKTEDLATEGKDYGKAKAIMDRKGIRLFPFGTMGGALGSHVLGVP
jgi:hypothetical protein